MAAQYGGGGGRPWWWRLWRRREEQLGLIENKMRKRVIRGLYSGTLETTRTNLVTLSISGGGGDNFYAGTKTVNLTIFHEMRFEARLV